MWARCQVTFSPTWSYITFTHSMDLSCQHNFLHMWDRLSTEASLRPKSNQCTLHVNNEVPAICATSRKPCHLAMGALKWSQPRWSQRSWDQDEFKLMLRITYQLELILRVICYIQEITTSTPSSIWQIDVDSTGAESGTVDPLLEIYCKPYDFTSKIVPGFAMYQRSTPQNPCGFRHYTQHSSFAAYFGPDVLFWTYSWKTFRLDIFRDGLWDGNFYSKMLIISSDFLKSVAKQRPFFDKISSVPSRLQWVRSRTTVCKTLWQAYILDAMSKGGMGFATTSRIYELGFLLRKIGNISHVHANFQVYWTCLDDINLNLKPDLVTTLARWNKDQ
jgi:hypothetical protein